GVRWRCGCRLAMAGFGRNSSAVDDPLPSRKPGPAKQAIVNFVNLQQSDYPTRNGVVLVQPNQGGKFVAKESAMVRKPQAGRSTLPAIGFGVVATLIAATWGSVAPRALVTAAAAARVSVAPAQQPAAPGRKPNILIIWGDDIGWFNV